MTMRSILCAGGLIAAGVATGATLSLPTLTQQVNDGTYKHISAVLISHKQQLLYEGYFNAGGPEVRNDMRSASKSMVSLAMGLALQQGLIEDVQAPVLPHFADKQPVANADPRKNAITIEDLLTMSSVLECDDWNSASRGNEERMYLIEDWSAFILNLPVRGIPPWQKKPAERPYGRAFSYCTGGVQVLTDLLERRTGMRLSAYLQKHLFDPLGIAAPEFTQTPLGVTNGGGGMRMRARDWIAIGNLLLQNGRHNKRAVIDADWIRASWQPRAVIDAERHMEYGYLWWIYDFNVDGQTQRAYAAAGNGGNYLFILPELDAAVLIAATAYNTQYMHTQSQAILTEHAIPALRRLRDQSPD